MQRNDRLKRRHSSLVYASTQNGADRRGFIQRNERQRRKKTRENDRGSGKERERERERERTEENEKRLCAADRKEGKGAPWIYIQSQLKLLPARNA